MKPHSKTATARDVLIREAVSPAVVVILAERPDPKSNILTLQDYHREGGSFIPIFRSKESFQGNRGH